MLDSSSSMLNAHHELQPRLSAEVEQSRQLFAQHLKFIGRQGAEFRIQPV
jgi:hypothetical protein